MNPMNESILDEAVDCLKNGGIIAYPTEAVYGLGCDPQNKQAVSRLRTIKNRARNKGFILVASRWTQVAEWVQPMEPHLFEEILKSWSGPITWVFPAKATAPIDVCSADHSIAIRLTTHPIAFALCEHYQGAIISTSANRENEPPIRDAEVLQKEFLKEVDYFVRGPLGNFDRPSEIRDAITGRILRS
jgi:L-threonylcarbamoyladenylate synthase